MSLVTDVLQALDRLEWWRTLRALPDRMAALEARMAEIDAGRAPGACPKCGKGPMRVVAVKPHDKFGELDGSEMHDLVCDGCGLERRKVVNP